MSKENISALEKARREYGMACARLGEVRYNIEILEEQLSDILEEIKVLNKRANYLQEQDQLRAAHQMPPQEPPHGTSPVGTQDTQGPAEASQPGV